MRESKLTLNGVPYSLTYALSDKLRTVLTVPVHAGNNELKLQSDRYESNGDTITFEFIDTCENETQQQGILNTYNAMARKAIAETMELYALYEPITKEERLETLNSLLAGAIKVVSTKLEYLPSSNGIKPNIGLPTVVSTDYDTLDNVRLTVSIPDTTSHLFYGCLRDWVRQEVNSDGVVSFLVEVFFINSYLFTHEILGHLEKFIDRLKEIDQCV